MYIERKETFKPAPKSDNEIKTLLRKATTFVDRTTPIGAKKNDPVNNQIAAIMRELTLKTARIIGDKIEAVNRQEYIDAK